MSKYFQPAEFERCTPPCKIEDMNPELLDMLDTMREAAGIPLVLNCAYRSEKWDKSKGRDGKSAHCTGNAVDIRCNNSTTRLKIIRAAQRAGFRRIGIDKSFVHVDNSMTHDQNVVWLY